MTNKLLLALVLFITGCSTARVPMNTADYAKTSAMITLENRQSGGSGVILQSLPNESLILTNKHVCQLIQNGGTVTTDEGSWPVQSFRVYKRHDLCLVKVLANLHQTNRIAETAPPTYSKSIIAGHPALLPTMITYGHFSSHMAIQMMIDTQKCEGNEAGTEAMLCELFGVKPIIQSFEAQPVTATIMAGSSGSGVFNDKGEVSGLVFAGQEGLSYGFIVPYVYVKDFITHLSSYPEQTPDPKAQPRNFFTALFKIKSFCHINRVECKGLVFQGIY